MKLITMFLLVQVCLVSQADMLKQAKREGWTFHFKEGKPYKTGLLFDENRRDLPHIQVEKALSIPDQYDLRGKISAIEDQGQCGSCWAFSLTATLRDALILSGFPATRLSQQYLVDCARNSYGCQGGYFESANYFVSPKGSPSWTSYPYRGVNGACKTQPPVGSAVSWAYIGSTNPSVEEVQSAILKYGPVSVTVGADNYFMSYQSGIYNACTNQAMNHMVNLVGWDNTQQYWIMRNSWGESWGEDGYMRIKFKGRNGNLCNRLAQVAAFVKVAEGPKPDKSFNIEGQTLSIKGSLNDKATYTVDKAKKAIQKTVDGLDAQ